MKHLLTSTMLAAAGALSASAVVDPGLRLAVAIEPRFGGAPLVFDALTNTTAAGQLVSVTRLDFLLSNVALHRADCGWLGLTNWFAFMSAREGRTNFELNNLPVGVYDRLRFQVGVPPLLNHADPAQFDPMHPLNPNVNGLHWNWQGGYVFFALEGQWMNASSPLPLPSSCAEENDVISLFPTASAAGGGYSYHIASDPLLMAVDLPIKCALGGNQELHLALNVEQVFSAIQGVTIADETSSTHSREGDSLAGQLRENIQRAFTVESLSPMTGASAIVATEEQSELTQNATGSLLVASNATPFGLTFSALFPRPALPLDNPLTEEGVHLGRLLFVDPRLSRNNAQSCATCHQPGAGFVDPDRAFSLGAEKQSGSRNVMPLFNLAWKSSFFWDGRTPTLRQQVLLPIQNPVEMHESLDHVVAKLRLARVNRRHQVEAARIGPNLNSVSADSIPAAPDDYSSLFARAFGSPEITADRIARALEQFLLTLVTRESKFDRFLARRADLTAEEQRGFELFRTEYDPRRRQFGADCFHCHGGPLFQSQTFANNGLDVEPRDLGRFLVTRRPGDRGKFAVPSLRNVALTAPYMHDGRFRTLEQVVEHYAVGVRRSSTLDPNLAKHPPGGVPLTVADQRALVAFLKTLTDSCSDVRDDRAMLPVAPNRRCPQPVGCDSLDSQSNRRVGVVLGEIAL